MRLQAIAATGKTVISHGGMEADNRIEILAEGHSKWTLIPTALLPFDRVFCHTAALIGHHLYVTGGWNQMGQLNCHLRWDFVDNVWTVLPGTDQPLAGHKSVPIGQTIVFSGGNTGHQPNPRVDTIRSYNTENNRWTIHSSKMCEAKACHASTTPNGRDVYIIGGQTNGTGPTDRVEVFNAELDTINSDGPKLPTPLRAFPAVAKDNCIYIAGGCTTGDLKSTEAATKTVYFLDKRQNSWQKLSEMNGSRYAACLEVFDDNKLIVAGATNQPANSVEFYDLRQDRWTVGPAMLQERRAFCCSVYNGWPPTNN